MRPDTLGALEDIRDAAQNIVDDVADETFASFVHDRRVRQLVERNFEIIGEVVNRLWRRDPSIAVRISSYKKIISLRNQLIHAYDTIDYELIWQITQEFLPVLRTEIELLIMEAETP